MLEICHRKAHFASLWKRNQKSIGIFVKMQDALFENSYVTFIL